MELCVCVSFIKFQHRNANITAICTFHMNKTILHSGSTRPHIAHTHAWWPPVWLCPKIGKYVVLSLAGRNVYVIHQLTHSHMRHIKRTSSPLCTTYTARGARRVANVIHSHAPTYFTSTRVDSHTVHTHTHARTNTHLPGFVFLCCFTYTHSAK